MSDEGKQNKDFKPSLLFRGELRFITPLVWIGYIASSLAVFFIVNWTPVVFEALKYSRKEAATAASLYSAMGAVGGLLLMRFTDKRGAIAITVMPIMTVILLLTATFVGMGHVEFLVLSAITGGFLIGGHFGMHSICGIFYPSAYRANGAGWATSIAKIGSVAGPILGGIVLSTSLPVRDIFAVLAVCPAVLAVCIYIVGRMHRRILGREALAARVEDVDAASARFTRTGKAFAIFLAMDHSCQYLCSELVTVTYEEQPGEIRQTTANLEEISTTCAVVLLEEKPKVGCPISLAVKGPRPVWRDQSHTVRCGAGLVCRGRFRRQIALASGVVLSATPA